MDTIQPFVEILLVPFVTPFVSTQRIYWLYLMGAAVMAFVIYVRATRKGEIQKKSNFLSYLFPKEIYSTTSSKVDFWYFLINRVVFIMFFANILFSAHFISDWVSNTLAKQWQSPEWYIGTTWIKVAFFTLGTVLLFDFGIFIAHFLQHKVALLWQFHKVHHSAEVLTPITLYRMHPVDDMLSSTCVALLTGTFAGAYAFLFAEPGIVMKVGGVNVVIFLYYLLGYNLRHSHIWISYGKILSRVFISPAQHQIHHSKLVEHHDRNFGLIFAFWDALFGTLVVPEKKLKLIYGLTRNEEKEFSSVAKLYFLPFKKCVNLIRNRKAAPS